MTYINFARTDAAAARGYNTRDRVYIHARKLSSKSSASISRIIITLLTRERASRAAKKKAAKRNPYLLSKCSLLRNARRRLYIPARKVLSKVERGKIKEVYIAEIRPRARAQSSRLRIIMSDGRGWAPPTDQALINRRRRRARAATIARQFVSGGPTSEHARRVRKIRALLMIMKMKRGQQQQRIRHSRKKEATETFVICSLHSLFFFTL